MSPAAEQGFGHETPGLIHLVEAKVHLAARVQKGGERWWQAELHRLEGEVLKGRRRPR